MSAGSTTRGTLSLTAPFERTPSDLCQTPPGRQSPAADEHAAYIDSLPRGDAAARPERARDRGTAPAARAHLWCRARTELSSERRDRADAGGRPARGEGAGAVFGERRPPVGAGHRLADCRGEAPYPAAAAAADRSAAGASHRPEPRASKPHHGRLEGHRPGLRRDRDTRDGADRRRA